MSINWLIEERMDPGLTFMHQLRQCSESQIPPLPVEDKMTFLTSSQRGTGIRQGMSELNTFWTHFGCKWLTPNVNLLSGKRGDSLILNISLDSGVVQRFKGKALVSPYFFISCWWFVLFSRQNFHLLYLAGTHPTHLNGKEAFSPTTALYRQIP